jgi:hypothetical protein
MPENEYRPASHRLQVWLPLSPVKLPGGQGVQETAPSSAKEPGWQAAHALAWLPENVPIEQLVQVLALVSENVPAGHPLQATIPLPLA